MRKYLSVLILVVIFIGAIALGARLRSIYGLILLKTGYSDQASVLLRQTVEADPGASYAHYNLAKAYYANGRYDQAVDSLETVLRQIPEFPDAYKLLSEIQIKQGDAVGSVSSAAKALKADPDNGGYLIAYGDAMLFAGRAREAAAAFAAATYRGVSQKHIRYKLGLAYLNMGLLKNAVRELLIAVVNEPGYSYAHYDLGRAFAKGGMLEKAEAELLKSVKLKSDYYFAWYELGLVYKAQGRKVDAKRAFKRAVQIDPETPNAAQALERMEKRSD